MPEIRKQIPGANEEVESAEIYIPDDADAGTGEFTLTLKPEALPVSRVFWTNVIHPPKLQVLATFEPDMNLLVQLGLHEVLDRKTFRVPVTGYTQQKHTVRICFSEWKVTEAFLNGEPLEPVT